jgi:hypothetical protein
VLNLTQQWNSVGTTFTGLKFNVDTTTYNQSAAASLLMDLQVGGVSQFLVRKDGSITLPSPYVMGNLYMYNNGGGILFGTSSDTILRRKGAANFQLGAADAATALAQTLSVQSVVAGATNNPAGADFTINGSQGLGSGAGGSIIFKVAPAGTAGVSSQNGLVNALTINSAGLVSVTPTSTSLTSFQASRGSISTPAYSYSTDVSSGVHFGAYNGVNCHQVSISGNLQWLVGSNEVGTTQIGPVTWAAKNSITMNTPDLYLYRDDANKLAQRNGTNAQEFRVYETTTGTIYKAILGNRQLMKISGASFDNGAGAQAGTITNSPSVGNPTKWIPIDDNGTTRYIPAW